MQRDGWKALGYGLAGLLLLATGALIPVQVRYVDRAVLLAAAAGQGKSTWASVRDSWQEAGRWGVAQWVDRLGGGGSGWSNWVEEAGSGSLAWRVWGVNNAWLDATLGSVQVASQERPPAVMQWLLPEASRRALRARLALSTEPGTMAAMGCWNLPAPVVFAPVGSGAGQPLESALLLVGMVSEQGRQSASLGLEWERLATAAAQGRGSEGLERGLLDLLSMARWLEWDALTLVLDRTADLSGLHRLTSLAGTDVDRWSRVVGWLAVEPRPGLVVEYLERHGSGGWVDLEMATGWGVGAVREVLVQGKRVHPGEWRSRWLGAGEGVGWGHGLASWSGRVPWLALGLKWILWLDGMFLLVLGLWHGRRLTLAEVNRRFQPRPDLRLLVVVAVAASVVWVLGSERMLSLKSSSSPEEVTEALPLFKVRLQVNAAQVQSVAMNEKVVGMLVAFLVIQFAVYLVGLSRLRHIRGQMVQGGVKLQLLDNEESMFDAPLYIGIGGSVFALVLRLTGFDDVSLMASYSSTLFGILFCFVLKVMHVRPYRQRLILEAAGKDAP